MADVTSGNPPITSVGIGSLTNISGKIYSAFEVDDVVTDINQIVTEAMWSTGDGTLTTFATQSNQNAIDYYINVYEANPDTDDTAEIQFAVAYGDVDGKGASVINVDGNDDTMTPSKAIYSQYRNLLLEYAIDQFVIDSTTVGNVLIINFERERLKEKLDAGNWELNISGSASGSFSFIDNLTNVARATVTAAGSIYDIVSGSIADGVYTPITPVIYGQAYVDQGILVFDAGKINDNCGITMSRNVNTDDNNHITFYDAISGSGTFKARNSQKISSTFYYVRVKNADYNFSNNPSFTTGSLGDLRWTDMYQDPKVYLTTVGLYNDSNELLAVAKISRPLIKNFQNEALIKVKIDW